MEVTFLELLVRQNDMVYDHRANSRYTPEESKNQRFLDTPFWGVDSLLTKILVLTAASHGSHHLRKRFDKQGPEQHRSPNSDPRQTLLGKLLNKSNMKISNPLIEAI